MLHIHIRCCLVEGSSAVLGSTQAGDLLVLDGEFIIVRDLFIDVDRLPGIDDYFLSGFYRDDFSVAVWLNVNSGEIIRMIEKKTAILHFSQTVRDNFEGEEKKPRKICVRCD